MNNLTLQQMEKLGISKWMNEKEREKAIEKALEEQKELIANDSHKEVFDALRTTDEILVEGGLFAWKFAKKTVRRACTKIHGIVNVPRGTLHLVHLCAKGARSGKEFINLFLLCRKGYVLHFLIIGFCI